MINSKLVLYYGLMAAIPVACALIYSGGKTSLSPEELMQSETGKRAARARDETLEAERKAQMNKVLFENRASMQTDWAIKKEQERAERRAARQ